MTARDIKKMTKKIKDCFVNLRNRISNWYSVKYNGDIENLLWELAVYVCLGTSFYLVLKMLISAF